MSIGPIGFFGFPPVLNWGFDLGLRQMFGWRDTYTQNVNLAGWMLGGWGNAIVDTDPWRMFQQSGRRFSDDLSTWLGLPPLPPPTFQSPFSLSIYDPMKQSTQTYVGAPAGSSPGYSAPAGEPRVGGSPGSGGADEKPLTEEERMEKSIRAEEAVKKKLEEEKKARDKTEADKASDVAKAAEKAKAATGIAAGKAISNASKARADKIIANPKKSWLISDLTLVKVPGRSDKIYKGSDLPNPVLCNGWNAVAVEITSNPANPIKTLNKDFGACDATKIYQKK